MIPMKSVSGVLPTSPYFLIIISSLIAIGPFTMEAYLPAIPTIATELNVSIVQVNLSISTFLTGLAIGQLVGGPISDQSGRKKNATFGLSLFCLSSIGIVFTHDIGVLQLLRGIQGLGAGVAAVVAMPTVRDIFEPEEAARKMPLVSASMLIAPMVAPVFGTVLMQWDWRVIFGFVAFLSMAILVSYRLRVAETRYQTAPVSVSKIFSQYLTVVHHRVTGRHVGMRYILLTGFSGGVFLTFLTNASWIYLEFFHVSTFLFPVFFAVHTFAFLLTNLILSRLLKVFDAFNILRVATLVQFMLVAWLLGLAWLGDLGLYTFVSLMGLVVGSVAMTNNGALAMLYTYFHQLTGSATSLMAFFRFLMGAALGVLSGMLFDNTLVPILATMLASSAICVLITRSLPVTTLREVAAQPRQEGL